MPVQSDLVSAVPDTTVQARLPDLTNLTANCHCPCTARQSITQSIVPSVRQSITRSVNQSINQSMPVGQCASATDYRAQHREGRPCPVAALYVRGSTRPTLSVLSVVVVYLVLYILSHVLYVPTVVPCLCVLVSSSVLVLVLVLILIWAMHSIACHSLPPSGTSRPRAIIPGGPGWCCCLLPLLGCVDALRLFRPFMLLTCSSSLLMLRDTHLPGLYTSRLN
jgi:hypothetical protein